MTRIMKLNKVPWRRFDPASVGQKDTKTGLEGRLRPPATFPGVGRVYFDSWCRVGQSRLTTTRCSTPP